MELSTSGAGGVADGGPAGAAAVGHAVAAAFRDEWARVLATVARWTSDLDLAEEATSEAFATALRTWARDGVPHRPGAWLTTTARRHALDRQRRRTLEREKVTTAAALAERLSKVQPDPVGAAASDAVDGRWNGNLDLDPDADLLRLVFTCCHPALPMEGRVALTLRSLTGMTTAQVARAFLVSEATMSQRLVRTKQRLKSAGISFRTPPPELLRERVSSVLAVLYLLFTEGYDAWGEPADGVAGAVARRAVADDAIRITRLVVRLLPDEQEARGLLALLLLQHARRDARLALPDGGASTSDGEDVGRGEPRTLEEQDRTVWHHDEIDEGAALLDKTLAEHRPGPYQVQAAIAALHATAPSPETTDWAQIVALYDVLSELTPSPVVTLNRAVAVGMRDGAEAGLAALAVVGSAPELATYHLLPAVRADLLRRAGRAAEAANAHREALALVDREGDRRLLKRRLAETSSGT